jgi:hypothetical protein
MTFQQQTRRHYGRFAHCQFAGVNWDVDDGDDICLFARQS